MHDSIQLTNRITLLKTSISRALVRSGFHLAGFFFVIALFALSATARAVMPPPDGGYAGQNTAEGTSALLMLTTVKATPL
jgi:hypothetical protein